MSAPEPHEPRDRFRAVIVVPVYRPELGADERIAWRHLETFLAGWDVVLCLPDTLASPLPGVALERFPAACFASVATYSRLLLSAEFYRRFERYELMLVHQLDALVLSSDLERWCAAGWDYVGAPWWKDPRRPELGLSRAGNGGLSLRRVASCLRVLGSRRLPGADAFAWNACFARPPDLADLPPAQRLRRRLRVLRETGRGIEAYLGAYHLNEDLFWSDRAALFEPSFKVAPAEAALAFAFEELPALCLERSGGRLPFGCHAWRLYGEDFWRPRLLPAGTASAGTAAPSPAQGQRALPPPPPGRTGWPWEPGAAAELGPAPAGGWPRISVVVPSFEQAEFLEETLRSILSQAYPALELLVIDGGSRDGSRELLERWAPWIDHWESEPDRGQSHAINKGFARATGELVTFFSSDDVYLPGAFADAARMWAANPGRGAVVGAFRFMDAASRPEGQVFEPRLPGPGPLDLALTEPGAWRLHQVATFYDRRALDRVGRRVREELRYTMDRELLYRVCRVFPVATSKRPYALFRRHAESKSGSVFVRFCDEMAGLHLLGAPAGEDAATRRQRRRLARYWRSRGHLKLAQAKSPSWRAVRALLTALVHQPHLPLSHGYRGQWLAALGLADPLRRLRRPVAGDEGEP